MSVDRTSTNTSSGSGVPIPLTGYDEKHRNSTSVSITGGDTIVANEPKTNLHRGLKGRHLSMIAMGGAIGTGLIISTGKGLASYGPGPMLIGLLSVAFLVLIVLSDLGEMATLMPLPGGFQIFADRFADRSLGFTVGYTYLVKYLIVTPNQITAGALVMSYWFPAAEVNPGWWILLFQGTCAVVNLFPVRVYGEIEFWLSALKVVILLALMIFMTAMTAGGVGPYHRVGGWPWRDPGAFIPIEGIQNRAAAQFVSILNAHSFAVFAYLGTELIGITVGESQNPRRHIPRAIKLTYWRMLFFYCGSILLIGLNLPSNSPYLHFANSRVGVSAAASPFVALMKQAGIEALSGALNGAILIFIISSASSDLYICGRTLYGLGKQGSLFKCFAWSNRWDIPWVSLLFSILFCSIAYVNVQNDVREVFLYFVELVTVNGLLTWATILWTHIKFVKARRVQNILDKDLHYVAPFGIWGSYIGLFVTIFFLLTRGLEPTVHFCAGNLSEQKYAIKIATSYAFPILFGILLFTHKKVNRTRAVRPEEVDFVTDKTEIDKQEEDFLRQEALRADMPKTFWRKLYNHSLGYIF